MNLLIDELPSEILIKICSYLPYHSEIALVNKRFYAVACKLNDPKITLILHRSLVVDPQSLKRIMNTTRNVTKVLLYLSNGEIPKCIIDILRKFSATIRRFVWQFQNGISLASFIGILSLVPNVTDLVLDFVECLPVDSESEKCQLMESTKYINFQHLKKLTILHCSLEFMTFFNRLPVGVLEELYLRHDNVKQLKFLFEKQTNIKKLIIYSKEYTWCETDIFPWQLESLEWCCVSFDSVGLKNILSSQKNLKSLKLADRGVDEEFMNLIVKKFTKLETLNIFLCDASLNSFKSIRKCNNLKELTLRSCDHESLIEHYRAFAKLDNSRITTLSLVFGNFVHYEDIDAIAKSVPNLKVLRCDCSNINTDRLHAILESFNFVETLKFDPGCQEKGNTKTLFKDGCFNQKLIELEGLYLFSQGTRFLKKIIKDYPNLKKLDVGSTKLFSTNQFKLILEGFSKIESLSLGVDLKLSRKKLNLLKIHKLRYFSFKTKFKYEFAYKMINELRKIFNSVKWYKGRITAINK